MSNKLKGLRPFFGPLPSKGRFRFFLYFILLSFTFWISTKLSNNYTLEQSFSIKWINVPKGIILSSKKKQINALITASGIEILLYRLINKSLNISLLEGDFSDKKGQVDIRNQQFLIQEQFFENTKLNLVKPIFLEFDFSRLDKKALAVVPKIQINLRAGYLIDSPLKITPDSILVLGPKSILDTLTSIESMFTIANDVYQSFRKNISLKAIPELQFSKSEVTIDQSVSRYSEKEFILNVKVINLPPGIRVKLFPPIAKVRATLPLSILRTVKASDFSLAVDYNSILKKEGEELELIMIGQPPAVKKLILDPQKVNYLIRR